MTLVTNYWTGFIEEAILVALKEELSSIDRKKKENLKHLVIDEWF